MAIGQLVNIILTCIKKFCLLLKKFKSSGLRPIVTLTIDSLNVSGAVIQGHPRKYLPKIEFLIKITCSKDIHSFQCV